MSLGFKKLLAALFLLVYCALLGVRAEAETISEISFSHINDTKVQGYLVYFLNHFETLNDDAKAQAAEALTVRILNLPAEPYEKTLIALKENFLKQPVSVEYLARFLHTTWLAKYGHQTLNKMTQDQIALGNAAGVAGLILTASASWKEPGKWVKYSRLVRDMFVPVGMAAGTVQLQNYFKSTNAPVPPMAYFDFPVNSEQNDELVIQAYQEMLVNISSVGAATGLTRVLMTSKDFLGLATEGASLGSRVVKPLLIVAALSWGAAELTNFAANEARYHHLLDDWRRQKEQMERSLGLQPAASYAQVNSFLQASRRMTFFMFYPVLKMQTEASEEINSFNQSYAQALDERQQLIHFSIKILERRIQGAPLFEDPIELLTQEEIPQVDVLLLRTMVQQLTDEAQLNTLRSGYNTAADQNAAMRRYMVDQIESLKSYLPMALAQAEEKVAANQDYVFEKLKQNLQRHLNDQKWGSCQADYSKYESLNQDRQRTSSVTTELNALNEKWQNDWSRSDLCRHSPLFLSQTYEYLKRIPHASAKEATQQSLELLVAQKILIESILNN